MPEIVLPLDAFIRSVRVTRDTPHIMFLGAGASISSGMPSAQMCIWEWKRAIFLTNNIGLEGQFKELSLASARQGIQRWLDKQGIYPKEGAVDEYGVYIEACFPIPDTRRAFFQEKVRNARPHTGYHLVNLLAANQLIKTVWTPNFDGLVSKASTAFQVVPVEIGIDSQERIVRAANRNELVVVSLHGDYRYDQLKNTAAEVQSQESALEQALAQQLRDTPTIVCGYSGRDSSIMNIFDAAMTGKGSGALYWCVQDPNFVSPRVLEVIRKAHSAGRTAHLVPIQGFDDLMSRLSFHCLDEPERKRAADIIAANSGGADQYSAPFQIDALNSIGVLKSNAFEIECPSEVLAVEVNNFPSEKVWRWVKDQVKGQPFAAVPFKGRVLALGIIDDVKACFGDTLKSIQRVPTSEIDFRYEDGATMSLMKEALVRTLAAETQLHNDGKEELWLSNVLKTGQEGAVSYKVHESAQLSLRHLGGRQFLVVMPSLKVLAQDGTEVSHEISKAVRTSLLGWQHNKEFNVAVNLWRAKLLASDTPQKTIEFPYSSASTFRFLVRRSPAFVEICGPGPVSGPRIDPKYRPLLKQKGIEIGEPTLLFSNKAGTNVVRDVHPVKGIVANRPFDFPLTLQGLSTNLRVAVICPKAETPILRSYLERIKSRVEPGKSEMDYLPAFPGFQNAFGVQLDIAEPGSPGWLICPEPDDKSNDRSKSVEIGKALNRGIEILQAAFAPHVVLLFFPERWQAYRGYRDENERFDVHDFVKANGVQRGIGTQFLDQSTLRDSLQCRVWWWLALAFYVKSMRTPWVLDGLRQDTAFVGIGMSVKPGSVDGKHVVLGCSHIYSSRGEGLQYRLSQVEDPVFFGKNPFLSRNDARRVGEQIRELFFESREALPGRVVIHKRTRFTYDEQLGLREGLSGIPLVEMIEIFIDDALRYVASTIDSYGHLREDNYPVRRGSVVKLDNSTALVWVHGVTSAISAGRRYYQGKRRIPAPLVIRRHAGQSDLRTVAEEILGLSKMNWNTFDLYTKMPSTVQSSNEIARIGALLSRFGSRSYDFRLFI